MQDANITASRPRLWGEFVGLFVGLPIVMAAGFGLYPLFPTLLALTGLACLMLARTPGWEWARLRRGLAASDFRILMTFAGATLAVSVAVLFLTTPQRFLEFPMNRPGLWLLVMVAYPLLSALPQEIIYRALFFERYGALFPSRAAAIAANGAAFGFGHLFYDNWVAILMTAVGGGIMGWAYLRRRALLLPWLMHSLAGQIVFTVGLGVYFYHGAVAR